jgi:hypothetical protein
MWIADTDKFNSRRPIEFLLPKSFHASHFGIIRRMELAAPAASSCAEKKSGGCAANCKAAQPPDG